MLKARRAHSLQLMDPFILVLELIASHQKSSIPEGLTQNFDKLITDFRGLVEGRVDVASVNRASLILKAIASERPGLVEKLLKIHTASDVTAESASDLVQSLEA